MTRKGERPQITLNNGAVVDAGRAVAIIQRLQVSFEGHPDEFRSLLALAEGRIQDADPRHFEYLWSQIFLNDDHSIMPLVRDVLLNSYKITAEGPVIVPLRLKDVADLPAAEDAQRQLDHRLRKLIRKLKRDEGPSV